MENINELTKEQLYNKLKLVIDDLEMQVDILGKRVNIHRDKIRELKKKSSMLIDNREDKNEKPLL